VRFLAESVEREREQPTGRSWVFLAFVAGILCGVVLGYMVGTGRI
jgi:F0F1-type ATP synthase assembly protein I